MMQSNGSEVASIEPNNTPRKRQVAAMPTIEVKMVTWKILVTASRKESRKKVNKNNTKRPTQSFYS
jgi:hypothetical protein